MEKPLSKHSIGLGGQVTDYTNFFCKNEILKIQLDKSKINTHRIKELIIDYQKSSFELILD